MVKRALCCLLVAATFQFDVNEATAARRQGRAISQTGGCRSIIPLSGLIYKGCSGSGHLSSDPRGKGVALIAKRGARLRPGGNCIPILNASGKKISGLQLYPGNDPRGPYAWRAYSNFGCGTGLTQTKLKKLANGKPIYLKMNSAGQCIQINNAHSNVNSAQRC